MINHHYVIALDLTLHVHEPLNPRAARALRADAADFERCSLRRDTKR
jgi:hypothetical protein